MVAFNELSKDVQRMYSNSSIYLFRMGWGLAGTKWQDVEDVETQKVYGTYEDFVLILIALGHARYHYADNPDTKGVGNNYARTVIRPQVIQVFATMPLVGMDTAVKAVLTGLDADDVYRMAANGIDADLMASAVI